MSASVHEIKSALTSYEFPLLFLELLGWTSLQRDAPQTIQGYRFQPLAHKAHLKVYLHTFTGEILPERVLKQLHSELDGYAEEHLTIFVDKGEEHQAWIWTQKTHGEPTRSRVNWWHKPQSGERLARKVAELEVDLMEEAEREPTITEMRRRADRAFNVEKTTKTFYEKFKDQHEKFLGFVKNISDLDDRKWYTSLMLNRLMFIYFIQRQGILDNHRADIFNGKRDYLRNRLAKVRQSNGPDNFYKFYRYFLLHLFHDGLSKREEERDLDPELERLIGRVPYLNGGLFEKHQLEVKYHDIQIEDTAFEQLFDLFDDYDWTLDDRQNSTNDKEINPDVLGYIFEKYINQKQMGAYYTKEDITGYIGKNTIIPFLFERVAHAHAAAFAPDGPIWSLLRDNPDDYIYKALAHGTLEELPDEIARGINDVAQRGKWNERADALYALPTETWREVVARHQRYHEVYDLVSKGKLHSINDLITYNLNITRFAEDVITHCDDASVLSAFYQAITNVTVLDPTCGSGAFLFAALNILKPLYHACLERMRYLLAAYEEHPKLNHLSVNHLTLFQQTLAQVDRHPNQEYFTLKTIIVNNLYGVDIMEEATEICKLRLFLKLVAQVSRPQELEPLPDIDFNILAGNTLIGFTSLDEIRNLTTPITQMLGDTEKLLAEIERDAQEIDRNEENFRKAQIDFGVKTDPAAKANLRRALDTLRENLNRYLAAEYHISSGDITNQAEYEEKYENWQKNYKPFHWWMEYYRIMKNGGFDVIIGNPPYVEYKNVRATYKLLAGQYTAESATNLYAFCMERSTKLLDSNGRFGMIVPAGLLGLDEVSDLRKTLLRRFGFNWFSTFAIRPSKLFDGVDQRLCIHIASARHSDEAIYMYTTIYHHWHAEERAALFSLLNYCSSHTYPALNRIPQVGSTEAMSVLAKLQVLQKNPLKGYYAPRANGFLMHYHRSPRYWIRGMDFEQYFKSETRSRSIHHFRDLYFRKETEGKSIGAILNSSLFFFWFILVGNGRNITGTDVEMFPVGPISDAICENLVSLFDKLMDDYKRSSIIRVRKDCEFQEFRPSRSKPIIDQIDRVLARHYGFTDEELDFIINYDIKYRMGRENGDESEE